MSKERYLGSSFRLPQRWNFADYDWWLLGLTESRSFGAPSNHFSLSLYQINSNVLVCRLTSRNSASYQNYHLTANSSSRQASDTIVNFASSNTPNRHPSSQPLAIPSTPSLLATNSLEPYISVGCLKCGASDHVATNRNCPRPRKASTAAYATPTQTPVPKKSTSKSPKKPAAENHHLKAAKIGDDTKFWYYISDDSEDGKQSGSNLGERIGTDEMHQDQGINTDSRDYLDPSDNGSRIVPELVSELVPSCLGSRPIINKSSKKPKKDRPSRTSQDSPQFAQPLEYGFLTEGITVTQPSVLHGQLQAQARQKVDLGGVSAGGSLGSIPSLPWRASATSPLSPIKHSIPSPIDPVKTTKAPKQRRMAPKPPVAEGEGRAERVNASPQKQPRKASQAIYTMPTKVKISNKPQENVGLVGVTREMARASHSSRQRAQAQPGPGQSPRYTAKTPQHGRSNTNSTLNQRIEDPSLMGTTETKGFKYNYMGARNTIQAPRIRYASNRVQGWRECRSMGTGLE